MNCESCLYYEQDEFSGDMICTAYMDEDEVLFLSETKNAVCPYYRNGDEYDLVRKQN